MAGLVMNNGSSNYASSNHKIPYSSGIDISYYQRPIYAIVFLGLSNLKIDPMSV